MPDTPPSADPLRERFRPGPATAAVAAAVSVAIVVGVAVLAAGSGGDDRRVSFPELDVTTALDVIVALLVVYAVAILVMLAVTAWRSRDEGGGDRPRHGRSLIQGMLVMGAVLWMVFSWAPDPEVEITDWTVDFSEPEPEPDASDTEPERTGSSVWVWVSVFGLTLVTVAALRWSFARAARMGEPPLLDPDAELRARRNRVIGVLDDAIAELRAHPDPRQAVIAVWARLEDTLELAGVQRHRADTPLRYLARVLHTVDASAPAVERLTEAFEHAMYSQHTIDRRTQLDAVDALVEVRDELRILARDDRSRIEA
jgi:protein-S-isoprenylcysteine O-methyltransferase Ste14